MSEMPGSQIPPRRDYGAGVFVRTLAIVSPGPGRVALAMEDIAHAFQVSFTHEHGRITSVQARWERHPLSECGGAAGALQHVVGFPLGDSLFAAARHTDSRLQCTHMYDMLCLAVLHAHLRREDRRYDVVVPDSVDGPVTATLALNGRVVLEIAVDDDLCVVRPERCQGISVLRGYMAWVKDHVPAQEQEYHFILQKALFVARAQKMDIESTVGKRAMLSGPPAGSCFGSQPERYVDAVRVGTVRRFTKETVGDVLRFFEPHRT